MEVEADEEVPEDSINMSIINELKTRRHMWDSRHKLYKDSEIKRRSWAEIARRLGVREPFLKTRWRSLRDRYMKERRRDLHENKTGEPRKVRRWAMMHTLDFLSQPGDPSTEPDLESFKKLLDENEREEMSRIETAASAPQPKVETASPPNNVQTYLIINRDPLQCVPRVKLPTTKHRPLRKIEPAPSDSARKVTLTIPTTATVPGSSGMAARIQQVHSIQPMPQLTSIPITSRQPEQEPESSERYFYLSIAKEMESRSTRVRLKMRKIISDALLNLCEEEEDQQEKPTN